MNLPEGVTAITDGPFPVENGDPATSARRPVTVSNVYPETVFELSFATYAKGWAMAEPIPKMKKLSGSAARYKFDILCQNAPIVIKASG